MQNFAIINLLSLLTQQEGSLAANPVVPLLSGTSYASYLKSSRAKESQPRPMGCSSINSDRMDILGVLSTGFSHVARPFETPPARLHSWCISYDRDQDVQFCLLF